MIGINILFFMGIVSSALTHPYYYFQQQLQDYDNNYGAADGFVFDGLVDSPMRPMSQFVNMIPATTTTMRPITTTTPALLTSTTPSPEYSACIRNCQATMEYNPVCGSDNEVYNNPSLLRCSKKCGKNVQIRNSGRCTSATRG